MRKTSKANCISHIGCDNILYHPLSEATMTGIQFMIDENGSKVAVQIDLLKHGRLQSEP